MLQLYLQTAVDGLLIGGVYATISVGLSLSFGVMRIINWAQGEFLMIGMYISFLMVQFLGVDPYLFLWVPTIVLFFFGYVLQSQVFNRMLDKDRSREPIMVLIFTVGLGFVLSNAMLIFYGANAVAVQTEYVGKTLRLGFLFISFPKFISFLIALAATIILAIFIQKTEVGRSIRATSQNRDVAQLMGINHKKVYSLAFGIGAGLVGLSASLLVPFTSVYPTIGHTYGFKSFIIVVLGGKSSIMGALLGGLIVGLIERIASMIWTETVGQLIVFVLFVIILLVRPNGLLSKDKEG